MSAISPITSLPNTRKLQDIDISRLKRRYLESYNIDITPYVEGIEGISLNECIDTGYRFYLPPSVAGDGTFYEKLSNAIVYYDLWKWEHSATMPYIKRSDKILEVGCGQGGFLSKLHHDGFDITGTELNQEQCSLLRNKGLNVFNELLSDHLKRNIQYDAVVSFQVLEHIYDVKTFILECINLLKPGGKFIFCVPNNDSFIKNDNDSLLNLPPHHMGLWEAGSARKLPSFFPLNLEDILFEPLQRYHILYYLKLQNKNKWVKSNLNKFLYYLTLPVNYVLTLIRRKGIRGHSLLAVYTKK